MSTYVISHEEYLAHHGIRGMKWGVRRFQNSDGSLTPLGQKKYGTEGPRRVTAKELRNYRNQESVKLQKNHKLTKQMHDAENQAYALAKKYKFDPDDGGNASTPAAKKAAKQYMELWEKRDRLEDQRDIQIKKQVGESLVKKYGSRGVKKLKRADARDTAAAVAALLSVPVGLGAIAALSSKS